MTFLLISDLFLKQFVFTLCRGPSVYILCMCLLRDLKKKSLQWLISNFKRQIWQKIESVGHPTLQLKVGWELLIREIFFVRWDEPPAGRLRMESAILGRFRIWSTSLRALWRCSTCPTGFLWSRRRRWTTPQLCSSMAATLCGSRNSTAILSESYKTQNATTHASDPIFPETFAVRSFSKKEILSPRFYW